MEATELAALVDRTRSFIREEVLPSEPAGAEQIGDDERRRLQQLAKQAGVFAAHVPIEYGGLGLPISQWSPVLQEAGYSPIGPAALNCMAPDEGNMHLLAVVATPEQKDRYLRPLVAGEVRSCFAMTEPHPGAGSDPDALSTTATRVPGGWRIDGVKRFISGADGAAFAIVMARAAAAEDGGRVRATMLIVDLDTPGVRLGAAVHTMDRAIIGGHPYVHFEGCVVPDEAVLGDVGEGYRYSQARLAPARLTHCMRWLGLARRAFDTMLDRADRRRVFGGRIRDLGIAQELIAQSAIDIETSDAMIAQTAALLVTDPVAGARLSSIAKVHCSEAIERVIDRAIQLTGGDGISDALPLAQFRNEVRPFRIYDGSNETHKWAIARRASKHRAGQVAAGAPRLDDVDEISPA